MQINILLLRYSTLLSNFAVVGNGMMSVRHRIVGMPTVLLFRECRGLDNETETALL